MRIGIGLGIGFKLTNGGGGGATPPVNTVAPVVSGTAVVGQNLTTTDGTWTGTLPITYSYQWYRGATPIGTNSNTYTLVQADAGNTSNIYCEVTATNVAGTASADSNTIAQILDATWNAFLTNVGISDTAIRDAFNTLTITRKALAAQGLAIYPFVTDKGTNVDRLADFQYNLWNTASFPISWAGGITATQADGVQGNGTSGTGGTGINSSTNFATNDFTIIWYSKTNQARNESDFGSINASANGLLCSSKFGDNNTYNSAQGNLSNAGNIISDTSGIFVFTRNGNTVTLKRNNVTIINRVDATNVKVNQGIRIISRMINGSIDAFSSKKYIYFEFNNFAFTSTQETNIYNAVLAAQVAMGRN